MNLKDLKKEIPFKWKVQTAKYGKAHIVAYIDARDVQDILDEVVGAENWKDQYSVINGNLYCGIGIKVNDEWVTKWDVGVESSFDKEKGNSSDAFKRAAVKWGVGRFLYSLPILTLKTGIHNKKEYPAFDNGTIIWDKEQFNEFCNEIYKSGQYDRTRIRTAPAKPQPKTEVKTLSQLIEEVNGAKSREELTAIWNKNKNEFKSNKKFTDAVTEKSLQFPKKD